jgi:hypothetical protein
VRSRKEKMQLRVGFLKHVNTMYMAAIGGYIVYLDATRWQV